MLIGAYRDNEVDRRPSTDAEARAIIKIAGGKVAEIALAPLARGHLGQLIADALRCEPEQAAPLAQLVHEKTGGNPFFAIQFISSLADERIAHLRSCCGPMVLGSRSHSRQRIHRQCGGPYGRKADPVAGRNPECLAAAGLSWQHR